MKLTVVVLVATLSLVAVGAAPQPSFEDFVSDTFEKASVDLNEWMKAAKCAMKLVQDVLHGTEFEDLSKQVKTEFDQLMGAMETCSDEACKVAAFEKLNKLSLKLSSEVAGKNEALAKKIHEGVESKCAPPAQFSTPIPEQMQCAADYLGEVSKANGMEQLWARSQPQLQQHLDNWKQCDMAGGKFLVIFCNLKEGASTFQILVEYMRLVAAQNPKVLTEFVRGLQSTCATSKLELEIENFDLIDPEKLPPFLRKIHCATRAYDRACMGTKFQPIFDAHRKAMWAAEDNIKECSKLTNKFKSYWCIAKELKTAADTLVPLFKGFFEIKEEMKVDKEFAARVNAELATCERPKSLLAFLEDSQETSDLDNFDIQPEIENFDLIDPEKLPPFLRKIHCATRAYDRACMGTKFQPIFDAHRKAMWAAEDNIKECSKLTNKFKSYWCIAKELKTAADTLVPLFKGFFEIKEEMKKDKEFAARVNAELATCERPKSLLAFLEDSQETSDLELEIENFHIEIEKLPLWLRKFHCKAKAYHRASMGTKFEPIFNAHLKAMFAAENNIDECRKLTNKFKVYWCIAKEYKTAAGTMAPFLKGFYKIQREVKKNKEFGARFNAEMATCKK